jgi:hypothetical protein
MNDPKNPVFARTRLEGGVHAENDAMVPQGAPRSISTQKTDRILKGVATGVAVSTITQTGRSLMSSLTKHPLAMFVTGFAAGYLVHKYRKEIVATAERTMEQGKDFVLRRKENLEDMLAESRERAEEADA